MTAFEGGIITPNRKEALLKIANENINGWDKLFIAVEGGFKEYLFATRDAIYIVKKGYMTGHTFGNGVYRFPYANIANVNVEYHIMSGYLEIATSSMQSEFKDFWSSDKKLDPAKAPNCITITKKKMVPGFKQVADKILKMAAEVQNTNSNTSPSPKADYTDELIKLKDLVDTGVITPEEFNAKKKQILGL